jgi:hypothetical protein
MIKPGTLLWFALIAAAIFGVYHMKYRVQAEEEELTRLDLQIARDRDTIQVLRAEWAHLNEPARLTELAQRHLALSPLAGLQIVSFKALPDRATATVGEEQAQGDPATVALLEALGGVGGQP